MSAVRTLVDLEGEDASQIGHNSGDADAYAADVDTDGDTDGEASASPLDAVPTDDKLRRVRDLCKLQVEREAKVADLEARLKTAESSLAEVAERDLPNLLTDLGFKSLPLANGATVAVKRKIVASVKVEDKPVFFDWLVKVGDHGIIKREISVQGGMGDFKKLGKLWAVVCRHYKEFIHTDVSNVHGGTLNAWARELTEKNEEALRTGTGKVVEPPDVCKLTELKESVITVPKGKTVSWS